MHIKIKSPREGFSVYPSVNNDQLMDNLVLFVFTSHFPSWPQIMLTQIQDNVLFHLEMFHSVSPNDQKLEQKQKHTHSCYQSAKNQQTNNTNIDFFFPVV